MIQRRCATRRRSVLLWAGRLDREKGVDNLLEIAKRVLPDHPDWTWDVYGSAVLGADGFDFAAELEAAGLADRVNLCGVYKDVRDVFPPLCDRHAHFVSRRPAAFLVGGLRIRPAVGFFRRGTGPRDIITEGENGCLIEPYDHDAYACALGRLMDDEDERARMSAASHRRADAFSEDAIYEKWKALIARCVS